MSSKSSSEAIGHLLVRCDAGEGIGLGHALRCLALTQAWMVRGGKVTFAMATSPPGFAERLASEGASFQQIPASPGSTEDEELTAKAVQDWDASAAVLDGYRFQPSFAAALRKRAALLLIDDFTTGGDYDADVVLNQNLHAPVDLAAAGRGSTRFLLGPRFALLRREFARWADWSRLYPPSAQRLVLTMGGSDDTDATGSVLDALERSESPYETRVLVGSANARLVSLRERASLTHGRVELVVDPPDVSEHFAWADVAISAAGSTCWELAYMRLPSVLLALAPNQQPLARSMSEAGAATSLDLLMDGPDAVGKTVMTLGEDALQRQAMGETGRTIVDGLGARRTVDALVEAAR